MSTQPAAGQDPDVAVIKEKLQTLSEGLRELAKATTEGMAATNVRLERVTEIALNLTQVQARMESHGEGLQRAFAAIKDVETAVEALRTDGLSWREKHDVAHAAIERRMNFAHGGIWALTGVAAIVMGVIIWALTPWFERINDNTNDIKQLQIQQARPIAAPAPTAVRTPT